MTSTLLDSTLENLGASAAANAAIGEMVSGQRSRDLYSNSHFGMTGPKAKLVIGFDGCQSLCSRSVRCTEIRELNR